jgi:signal transduction histidine kinase
MPPQKKKNKILIIDDDAMNLLILEEILGKDYELIIAGTGNEAIELTEKNSPDLILLDIMMENENGYDVCKRLKSNKNIQFTKIILVSSKAMLKDRLTGYSSGADDYLSIPFDPEELMAKVKVFIRLKSVEEIDRVKDDLINIFSHETRTPLNGIIGFAKLLKESPSLENEEKEFVDLIIESGMSLLSLSNKAILLSSLRKENKELDKEEIPTKTLIERAIEKLAAQFEQKKISVKNNAEEFTLIADEQLTMTAVSYLLDNALKFNKEEGEITVSSGTDEQNRFFIKIKDTGCGIPPARLDQLFDEFGIEDVSHHGRGHGLSLAIVKYIMILHQGEVVAANNENENGSCFTLLFPIGEAAKENSVPQISADDLQSLL